MFPEMVLLDLGLREHGEGQRLATRTRSHPLETPDGLSLV